MFIGFSFLENLGEFRIRGFIVGLYLRNISNENLGTSSMFGFKAVRASHRVFHCALILCLHYLQILRVRVMHCIPSAYFLHTLLRISISHAKGRLQKRRRKRSLSLHLSRVLYKVFIHHPFRFGV